ncbi:MAG TPA: sigma-70 region 4 domain-containing protein [Stenotrophomonas sp.]|nr:sigma-70 region 4 domain-containing protein [Stenotrophomonas sp.]
MDTDSAAASGHGPPLPAERVWSRFLAALDELPADARAVLLLHDVFGASLEEAALLVGLPVAACRQRLERARRCLLAHAQHLEPRTP